MKVVFRDRGNSCQICLENLEKFGKVCKNIPVKYEKIIGHRDKIVRELKKIDFNEFKSKESIRELIKEVAGKFVFNNKQDILKYLQSLLKMYVTAPDFDKYGFIIEAIGNAMVTLRKENNIGKLIGEIIGEGYDYSKDMFCYIRLTRNKAPVKVELVKG